jgi:hypothetical protein
MPFREVEGKTGTPAPAQIFIADPKLKLGVVRGFTVILLVMAIPHRPAVGVKVYEPEAWLSITEGLQVPVIPFFDVVGNTGGVDPAQIAGKELNVGIRMGLVNINPVFNWVVQPFTSISKSE